MVSQLFAQRHPDLVDRLVLFGYPRMPGSEVPIEEPDGEPPRAATTAEAAASDFVTEGSISRSAVEAYVEASLASDPIRVDWTARHQWNALDASQVTVPTLVIHGEFDPLAPVEAQGVLFNGLASTDKAWVVIPGGDHAAFLETPRPYFLAVLEAFLIRGG
jgi:pimeloyl-ACP methyl ester carboxylesterase